MCQAPIGARGRLCWLTGALSLTGGGQRLPGPVDRIWPWTWAWPPRVIPWLRHVTCWAAQRVETTAHRFMWTDGLAHREPRFKTVDRVHVSPSSLWFTRARSTAHHLLPPHLSSVLNPPAGSGLRPATRSPQRCLQRPADAIKRGKIIARPWQPPQGTQGHGLGLRAAGVCPAAARSRRSVPATHTQSVPRDKGARFLRQRVTEGS